jgi:hypothetical protein
MPFFRKLPVVIEARCLGLEGSAGAIRDWIMSSGGACRLLTTPHDGTIILIETLEGTHRADVGDWVIKGVAGEFYPCKPHIFEQTYTSNGPDTEAELAEEMVTLARHIRLIKGVELLMKILVDRNTRMAERLTRRTT